MAQVVAKIQEHRQMHWKSKTGPIKVSYMGDNYIKAVIELLKKTPNNVYNGYTAVYWMIILESELKYRTRMFQNIVNQFPVLKQAIGKQIAQKA